jgi:hypothetical protein
MLFGYVFGRDQEMILNIDGAFVIYEGLRRLRWSYPAGSILATPGQSRSPQLRRIVDQVWPDRSTQTHIRRQIEHGQKVVVIIDRSDPIVVVPADCLPRVPFGSTVAEGPDNASVALSIPPFTWLSAADRARGEVFSAHAQSTTARLAGPAQPQLLVEGALVGTREPLRFVFESRSMTIDILRQVIHHLYTARNPSTMHVTAAEQNSLPLSSLQLPAAA